MNTFYAKDRKSWREWLKNNCYKEPEIWLLMYKKHTGKFTLPYQDALEEALCFGWIDTRVKRVNDEKYVTRFSPRAAKSQWSTTNVALYRALKRAGLVTAAGEKAFLGKSRIYKPVTGKNAWGWHQTHKLGKFPTLKRRITWHREHQKHCGCRPIPKSLLPYFS